MEHPVDTINYLDYDLRTVMDKPRTRLARHWRFNQFQFVSAMAPGWVSASMAQVLVVAPPSAQAPGGGVQAAPAFTNGGYLYSGLTGKLLVHCGTAWGEAVYQEFDGCGDEVMGA